MPDSNSLAPKSPPDQNDPPTPEDVATLYSWANLHGAKYRDFSASRAEAREQARIRAEEAAAAERRRKEEEEERRRQEEAQIAARLAAEAAEAARQAEAERLAEIARQAEAERQAVLAAQEAQRQAALQRAWQPPPPEAYQGSYATPFSTPSFEAFTAPGAAPEPPTNSLSQPIPSYRASAAGSAHVSSPERGLHPYGEPAQRQAAASAPGYIPSLTPEPYRVRSGSGVPQPGFAESVPVRSAYAQQPLPAYPSVAHQDHSDHPPANMPSSALFGHAASQYPSSAAQGGGYSMAQPDQYPPSPWSVLGGPVTDRAVTDSSAEERAAVEAPSRPAWLVPELNEPMPAGAQPGQFSNPPDSRNTGLAWSKQANPPQSPANLPAPYQPSTPAASQAPVAAQGQVPMYLQTYGYPGAPLASSTPGRNQGPSPTPVDDTLVGSRDRIANRWYALKSVFDPQAAPVEQAPAAPPARVPALAVFSLAGGVGKTSLVASLGRALSSRGERVLLVDTAAYGLLPFFFGARDQRPGMLRTFNPPGVSAEAPIQLVTLDPDGQAPEAQSPDTNQNPNQLRNPEGNQDWLAHEVARYSRGSHRILVDLPTASGSTTRRILKLNPVVLVPVSPDMNSVVSVGAIEAFFRHNGAPGPSGKQIMPYYILNHFDYSLPLHLDVREILREQIGDRLLPFALRRSPAISEALAEGMTVIDYAPTANVAEDYAHLAEWVRSLSAPAMQSYRGVRWSER